MTTWGELTSQTKASSDYMSDSLCHAILDYEEIVESKNGKFDQLLINKENLESDLSTKESEMFDLQTDLAIINDQLDIAKANEDDTTQLESDKQAKELEINNKQAEIDDINSQIDNVDNNISTLKSEISIENNFTTEQIQERNQYIIERTWTDDNYIDDKELYEDAIKKFQELKIPKTEISMSIVNFREILEEQRNWDKLKIGDTITIKYEKLNVNVKALVTEINYNDGDLSISITNLQDMNKKDKLVEMLYQSHSTSTTVDMSKYKWTNAEKTANEVSNILDGAWDAADRRITAGVNESVDISRRGIIVRNPDFPDEIIIIQSGVIALSENGGQDWKTAITPKHIVAERLFGKIIAGENLIIESSTGKFTFDDNGATIDGSALNIIGGTNGVAIDSDDGIIITKDDNKVRIRLNAVDGFKIQNFNDISSEWEDVFFIDVDGNINASNVIAKSLKVNDNNDTTLIDADDKRINFDGFTYKDGVLTEANIPILKFDKSQGGTLTLGGTDNGNGRLIVLDANGESIADLDAEKRGFNSLHVVDFTSPSVATYNNEDFILHVRAGGNGDDANSGLDWDNPLRSVGEAIRRVSRVNDGHVTIILSTDYKFYEEVNFSGITGSGTIEFDGSNVEIQGRFLITNTTNRVLVENINLNSTSSYSGFSVSGSPSTRLLDSVIYGNGCSYAIECIHGGFLELSRTEIYEAEHCIRAGYGATVMNIDTKGHATNRGLYAYGGYVTGSGTCPSGDTATTASNAGGQIFGTFTADSGTATPPPAPETTDTWSATSSQTWRENFGGQWHDSDVLQGKWDEWGLNKGYWFFGTSPNTTVSGKTVQQIRVYLKRSNNSGSSGSVNAIIRPHGYASQPSSDAEPSMLGTSHSVGFKWGEGKWVTLPSSFHSYFENGSAYGIGIYTTSTSNSNYMRFNTSAKIQITYA